MASTAEDLTTDSSQTDAVVTLTPEAHKVVADAIGQEPDPELLALWVEIRGVQGKSFNYDLYFQAISDADDADAVRHDGDLVVVIPEASVDRLQGARLEWSEDGDGGLVLVNPNTPAAEDLSAGVPPEILEKGTDSPLATRVKVVLEQVVNPSIASHGGRADLLAFDEAEGVAYLMLSGGCQGCAMSRMTLTQGIEVALKEEVPEVVRVVDVTDHGSGENPYY